MMREADRSQTEPEILIGGDPDGSLGSVRAQLESEGIRVRFAPGGQEALKALREGAYAIVAMAERLDGAAGSTLLRKAARAGREILPVLLLEAGERPDRSELPPDTIVLALDQPAEIVSTLAGAYRERVRVVALERIVGDSEPIRRMKQAIRQVAPTRLNVLITGESGTGKELVAQAIHELSPRHAGPFVAVNAGALPEGVLESELFGHEKGSFTGAHNRRPGRFELADGGSLFLDEIGDMPAHIQVKLLRVLEESRFLRVGGTRNIEVDVRLITATNRNLEEAVERGSFRHDLYFRLNVIHLEMPPLRSRRQDIPKLVEAFSLRVASENQLKAVRFPAETMELLVSYHWPGNVRELRNLVERVAVLQAGREVTPEQVEEVFGKRFRRGGNLPALVGGSSEEANRELLYRTLLALRAEMAEMKAMLSALGRGIRPAGSSERAALEPIAPRVDLDRPADREVFLGNAVPVDAVVSEGGDSASRRDAPLRLAELERDAISRALTRTGGNRRRAARLLGIGERTLYRKLRDYDLIEPSPG